MDFTDYLAPIPLAQQDHPEFSNPHCLFHHIDWYANEEELPGWRQADIVLLGCWDGLDQQLPYRAADHIRYMLYRLAMPMSGMRIADLGNLMPCASQEDALDILAAITTLLVRHGKLVVLLGGNQAFTYGLYRAYQQLETRVEYVSIDSRPDIWNSNLELSERTVNHRILTHTPDYLADFTVLGTQQHYISAEEREAMQSLHCGMVRLGELNTNLRVAEPVLRTAHLVSMDIGVVQHTAVPAAYSASPVGLTPEQLCQLGRYAGMGYWLGALHLANLLPEDQPGPTADLAALVVWYLAQAWYTRAMDLPAPDRANLLKHTAILSGAISEIVFYKHPGTGRWWMEVAGLPEPGSKPQASVLVPCSENDYQTAQNDDIPEKWWRTYYKLLENRH